jgi:hypothetical protein
MCGEFSRKSTMDASILDSLAEDDWSSVVGVAKPLFDLLYDQHARSLRAFMSRCVCFQFDASI